MYGEVERELEALNLLTAQRKAKSCDAKTKMSAQCDTIQSYVSIITTDWVRKAALRLGIFNFHQRYVVIEMV
jgi:hypothetical protein